MIRVGLEGPDVCVEVELRPDAHGDTLRRSGKRERRGGPLEAAIRVLEDPPRFFGNEGVPFLLSAPPLRPRLATHQLHPCVARFDHREGRVDQFRARSVTPDDGDLLQNSFRGRPEMVKPLASPYPMMRNPRRPRSLSFLSTVTESTLALLGPRSLQSRTFLTSISSPSRIASTAPSGRFLTHPSTLLALATSLIEALNSTPWTMPRTTTLSATLAIEPHLASDFTISTIPSRTNATPTAAMRSAV